MRQSLAWRTNAVPFQCLPYKAFRHVENLLVRRFLFIHPRFVFIVQGSLLVVHCTIIQALDE